LKNVLEFRAQASRCRQLAVCDTKNSDHWIAEAEKWSRLAQDEISLHEECNALQASDFPAPHARPTLTQRLRALRNMPEHRLTGSMCCLQWLDIS
jgi:hypothetical protein